MFNSESLKIFYLSNDISCWIPKWIDDVLHFRLTACLLVQVSQAIIDKVTSVGKKTFISFIKAVSSSLSLVLYTQ